MECTTEIYHSSGGKRSWPNDLKARIVAETLVEGTKVNVVAARYDLSASRVSDWRRKAREGQLILPCLAEMDFASVEVTPKIPEAMPIPPSTTLDLIKGSVTIRLDGATSAARIAEIVAAL